MIRAAAVLLSAALLVACRSPGPGSGSLGIARCEAAKARARTVLAERRACDADWDCQAFATPLLGCDGIVADGAAPPRLDGAVQDACTNLPVRALRCAGRVPACIEGQCTFRPRTDTGCDAARAAFVARLDEAEAEAACAADDDCGVRQVGDRVFAFALSFARDTAREARAFEDACGADQESREQLPGLARCVEGRCRASWDHRREDWVRPHASEQGCFPAALARRGIGVRSSPGGLVQVVVRFPVRVGGAIGPFDVSGGVPDRVEAAIIDAALSCRWRPAVIYGVERERWNEIVMFLGQ